PRRGRALVDNQRVSLTGGFINKRPGLCHPIVLQVSPMTAHRIAMNCTDVVMGPQHGAGETFQNYAEPAGRNIKTAGLDPDTIRVRHPETVIFQVGVSNEVFAVPLIRIEAVGETVEGSNWHLSLLIDRCL